MRTCNTVTYKFEQELLSTDYQQLNVANDIIRSISNGSSPVLEEDEEGNIASWDGIINNPIFIWIQFGKSEYLAMKMSAQFGFTDFLSQCGGLLGLFMGVSILSIVEVIYYFTIKLMHRKSSN